MQHRVQLHDQRRQGRETAAKANGKQQSVLVGNKPCLVEPGCAGHQLRDHAHGEATEQIRAQRAPGKC